MQASRRRDVAYTPGELRICSGYTDSWLRRLEKRGVLHPRRDHHGYRIYSQADLAALEAWQREAQRRRGFQAKGNRVLRQDVGG